MSDPSEPRPGNTATACLTSNQFTSGFETAVRRVIIEMLGRLSIQVDESDVQIMQLGSDPDTPARVLVQLSASQPVNQTHASELNHALFNALQPFQIGLALTVWCGPRPALLLVLPAHELREFARFVNQPPPEAPESDQKLHTLEQLSFAR